MKPLREDLLDIVKVGTQLSIWVKKQVIPVTITHIRQNVYFYVDNEGNEGFMTTGSYAFVNAKIIKE